MPTSPSPHAPLSGSATVPGEECHTLHALLLGGLAVGESRIDGASRTARVDALHAVLGALGIATRWQDAACVVQGVGIGGLAQPTIPLETDPVSLMPLLGMLAGHEFLSIITVAADASPSALTEAVAPLSSMGAVFHTRPGKKLPLTLSGRSMLVPVAWQPTLVETEACHAMLLAGLHAPGETSFRTARHPESGMMTALVAMGAQIEQLSGPDDSMSVALVGQPELRPLRCAIAGDRLIAGCATAAAAGRPGSDVRLARVPLDPAAAAWLDLLRRMGAELTVRRREASYGGDMGELHIRGHSLKGIELAAAQWHALAHYRPAFICAAAQAEGPTIIRGAAETLPVSLSGGPAGARIDISGDDAIVHGGDAACGTALAADSDDRHAIPCLALASSAARPITTRGLSARTLAFLDLMNGLGARLDVQA
jgi:3-phosphoshikimate 1-carboxyvinyltransferase